MLDWLQMGGYGFYVWSSYGMLALAIAVELFALRQRRRSAQQHADEVRAEQPQRPPEQPLRASEQRLRANFPGNSE